MPHVETPNGNAPPDRASDRRARAATRASRDAAWPPSGAEVTLSLRYSLSGLAHSGVWIVDGKGRDGRYHGTVLPLSVSA